MKRTRRKQPPAGQPCPPPSCTAQASGISFPWQGTESEQEGGENRGNSLGRDTMLDVLPDGSRIAMVNQPERGHERFASLCRFLALLRTSMEAVRWARDAAACLSFHMRIRNRGLTAPATADLFT